MAARGHSVSVVTAHPHYPPLWGSSVVPRREVRDGIPILRLPIRAGHRTTAARIGEELTYGASAAAAAAVVPAPDVHVAVSPSFLALLGVRAAARARRRPWVLWLQDILPDAAATTGLLDHETLLAPARALERGAYRTARKIVVISETFADNLVAKGVPREKIEVVYNPAARGIADDAPAPALHPPRLLHIGNIGLSQGLARVVEAFDASELDARFIVLGTGEAVDEVRSVVRSARVELRGLVAEDELDRELAAATLGVVTQRPDVAEFNVPSRLMTFLGCGVPVVVVARRDSEVARIVERSGAGWAVDAASPEAFPHVVERALADRDDLARRREAAVAFARRELAPARVAEQFDMLLREVVSGGPLAP
jgi:colanic acid biosynthesis glycosyl transferase WcaI